MTLYTAWPTVRFWLQRPEMTGWHLTLSAVRQPNRRTNPSIPTEWYRDATVNLESIREFAAATKSQNNVVQAFGYDFTPAIHGFRVGTGDLYWSALKWGSDGKLSMEGYSYEYVPADDRSPAAEAKRAVFDSWLQRSRQVPFD